MKAKCLDSEWLQDVKRWFGKAHQNHSKHLTVKKTVRLADMTLLLSFVSVLMCVCWFVTGIQLVTANVTSESNY